MPDSREAAATEDEQSEAPSQTSRWLRIPAIVAGALGVAWLLSPSLHMVHVEGFSASIAALALHLAHGSLADFDLTQPFNTEYFALTKLGMVLAVAGLTEGLGIGSEIALRIVMWTGFAGLVGGSIALGRRWSGAPWWLALPALALTPGVFESLFFYNDNVPAAGLMATGLALLNARRTALALPLAGLMLGLAVLTRTDTVLVGIAAPIMLLARYGRTIAALRAMAVVGVAAAVALFVPLALLGTSILDVFKVGGAAVALWDRANGLVPQFAILLYYFSLPGLLLAGIGAAALVRRGDRLTAAAVLGTPALYFAMLYGSIWEVRQLLVLTPFFVALQMIGVRLLASDRKGPVWLTLRAGLIGLFAISLFGPIGIVDRRDGPRTFTGRIYAITLWRGWQRGVASDFQGLDTLIAEGATPGRPLVVLSDNWNEDRYFHLALLEGGFRPDPRPLAAPCRPIAERFVRGDVAVIHLRLHQSYSRHWRELAPARLTRWALPCLESLPSADPYLIASLDRARGLVGDDFVEARETESPLAAWLSYGPIVAVPLGPNSLQVLSEGYLRDSLRAAAERPADARPPSPEAALATTGRRTGLLD